MSMEAEEVLPKRGDVGEEAAAVDGGGAGDFVDEVEVGLVHEDVADGGGIEVVAGEQGGDGAGDFARGVKDDGGHPCGGGDRR